MKAVELAKAYNPKDFEDRIYRKWMESGSFQPADGDGAPFVIVIPPPNVTGVLHMGHGLNNSLQDILIRYHRMTGRPTLWVPGTDHAGIATQNVVEKRLRKRGTSRREMGREKFLEETWKVKEEHHEVITRQLQKIAASCDWSRERFTLDDGLSRAVREVFVGLYERGLIYRGNYLVNWCHSCGTALSDDEVDHQELTGRLYRYYYPLSDGSGTIEVATTRPETMLGDTAVAVHPEDPRYTALIGKMVSLPLTDREIPVVADPYVEREFGSGAVKITPAHDSNDCAIAERHNLPKINILTPDGKLNDAVPGKYRGLDVITARKVVVADLKEKGLYISDAEHKHQVGHCYRCETVIEPYMSEQWFVRMQSMADKALAAWEKKEILFYPKKWENTYTAWLRNIRDWCISRQLWWGHRIPVWYCEQCGEVLVCREDPSACSSCGSEKLRQDPDVLDTWFSSWLWPFSTLGWPDKSEDMKRFFPTSTLVTGYDIIFFWVARMIMASLEFLDEVPFRDIYITGLVRDKQGRKMSKSLGNGMDPLEVVDQFGADAMKFTLAFLAAQGQDILLAMDDFKFGSKFANKIWNATRFLLMNLEGRELLDPERVEKKPLDRWIFHRLNEAAITVGRAMGQYRFNEAANAIYEFFWNDFCDWYIEASKLSLYSDDDAEKDRSLTLLIAVLEESMRLAHPFLSFITEEIYEKLPGTSGQVITAAYPEERQDRRDEATAASFSALQELIRCTRTVRSEFTIPPEKKVDVHVRTDEGFFATAFFGDHAELIQKLTGAQKLVFSDMRPEGAGNIPVAGVGFEVFVDLRDVIDLEKELAKLKKELGKLKALKDGTEKKLSNRNFLDNAPDEVVAKEKDKLKEFTDRSAKIASYLKDLGA
jgi:valyl-tRNA synthetase